jgi:hypothetical protein
MKSPSRIQRRTAQLDRMTTAILEFGERVKLSLFHSPWSSLDGMNQSVALYHQGIRELDFDMDYYINCLKHKMIITRKLLECFEDDPHTDVDYVAVANEDEFSIVISHVTQSVIYTNETAVQPCLPNFQTQTVVLSREGLRRLKIFLQRNRHRFSTDTPTWTKRKVSPDNNGPITSLSDNAQSMPNIAPPTEMCIKGTASDEQDGQQQ